MLLALFLVVVLIALAVFDLTVGVANDAINFLNSSLGSKAAKFNVAMTVAAIGVFVGAYFSGGMLEVARKGIFYPQNFQMLELLLIFTAVMFGDVILLDIFNTYGLPTSTTVSLISGLLGGSVGMALTKVVNSNQSIDTIFQFINTASVLKIFTAIFISIIIAFIGGTVIQYITRFIFTFDYKSKFKKYGAIWSSIVFAALIQFVIVKGAKHSNIVPEQIYSWITSHFWATSGILFILSYIPIQLLISFTKINVLKFIVLFGTFSLALSFASNDLVNFIGAPIAGLNAYSIAVASGNDPMASMVGMNDKIPTNFWVLGVSGLIMVVTLFTSKKAKLVAQTELDLGRQNLGYEKFESNMIGRSIVKFSVDFVSAFLKLFPESFKKKVGQRFDTTKFTPNIDSKGNPQQFDLIRATVILFVSSSLITFGTSLKLPLSTTYVTFIAAMACALPDRAWGRESAAYRVSGVITVISGWFLTAFFAAGLAFVFSIFLAWQPLFGVITLLIGLGFIIYKTYKRAKARTEEYKSNTERITSKSVLTSEDKIKSLICEMGDFLASTEAVINDSLSGLMTAKLDLIKKSFKSSENLNTKSGYISYDLMKMMESKIDADPSFHFTHSQTMILFQTIADKVKYIAKSCHKYIDNKHQELDESQIEELSKLTLLVHDILSLSSNMIKTKQYNDEQLIKTKQYNDEQLIKENIKIMKKALKNYTKNQMSRQTDDPNNVRKTMLILNILAELNNIIMDTLKIYYLSKKIYIQNIRSIHVV